MSCIICRTARSAVPRSDAWEAATRAFAPTPRLPATLELGSRTPHSPPFPVIRALSDGLGAATTTRGPLSGNSTGGGSAGHNGSMSGAVTGVQQERQLALELPQSQCSEPVEGGSGSRFARPSFGGAVVAAAIPSAARLRLASSKSFGGGGGGSGAASAGTAKILARVTSWGAGVGEPAAAVGRLPPRAPSFRSPKGRGLSSRGLGL